MDESARVRSLLDDWFGDLDEYGMSSPEQEKRWFNPPAGFDDAMRRRFGDDVDRALAGKLDAWARCGPGTVCLILLLDQLTRNIFRGTPRAFSGDPAALALARRAAERGLAGDMPLMHRIVLCMPYQHAEDLAAQDEGLAIVDCLLERGHPATRPRLARFRRFMAAHREVVARFGRFPHRNAILGRESGADELAYLERHGGF